jgi:hypothetical protein
MTSPPMASLERRLLLDLAVERGKVAALLLAVLHGLRLAEWVRADDEAPGLCRW